MIKSKLLSIVVPVYNEEKNLPLFYKQILSVFGILKKYRQEVIFIDDGSKDDSWKVIQKLADKDKRIKGIGLSKNGGHQNALEAGYNYAHGDAIVSIDADLQQPIELIPTLVQKWEKGNLVVKTIRRSTENIGFIKNAASNFFYFIINSFSSLKLEPGEADFRLLDRSVLDKINKLPEKPKFYRGIISWITSRSTKIYYRAKKRIHGKSSYSFRKMFELARIGLTSFSMLPLKIIITFGMLISTISGIVLVVMLYFKFLVNYNFFGNITVLATLILFTTGLMVLFQGIVALYIIDIYNTSKNRPNYVIERTTSRTTS